MTDALPASLLRERPFVQFWVARISTTIASQMQAVAVGWQMYELTGKPLDLGLVGLVQFVPSFLLVLVAGHFADRHDRRRIIAAAQAVAGLASALLTIGTAGGFLTREWILAIVFMVGVARAFEQPTVATLLPALVSPPLLPRAVASSSAAGQMGMIVGPAIGGLIYALSPIVVYGCAAACSSPPACSCSSSASVRTRRSASRSRSSVCSPASASSVPTRSCSAP